MYQYKDYTYCEIVDYVEKLSMLINAVYDICPEIFLRFNQNNEIGGSTVLTYKVSDIYIELDIPHNYTFGKAHKATLTCILIHEYCHYIDSLTMSGRERANNMKTYTNDQKYRRAEEQRNWTATKQLAKKLGLWNKSFYAAVQKCYYTAAVQF